MAKAKSSPESKIGEGVRIQALRRPGSSTDPDHVVFYHPLGPVNGKGGINICGPYEPVEGWPTFPHPGEWRPGSARGIYVESPDRIIALIGGEVPEHHNKSVWGLNTFRDLRFLDNVSSHNPNHRRCHEIVVFNRQGKMVDSWDQWRDELVRNSVVAGIKPNSGHANRIRVDRYDPKRHVWIVGTLNTGVFKFTNDGKDLVMKIEAKDVPAEHHPFYYPQDIAFLPNGDFFIGHLHHVMRFSKDGKFLFAFGKQGFGPLEFDGLHDIVIHPDTLNLFINDRVNERVQIIGEDGKLLDIWPALPGVYSMRFTADGRHVWMGNGFVQKFLEYDMNGKLIPSATWGTFGIAPGTFWGPHYFDTDIEGNLYIAEDYKGGIQKLRPLAGVDPADPQLIGQLCR